MDESGAVYYTFSTHTNPSYDADQAQGIDLKRCSVRGCTQFVADGSNNKMCDVCRGRHRIYATTKRARRKLEKAAVANAVAARNGTEPLMLIHESDSTSAQSHSTQSAWVENGQLQIDQENSIPNSQSPPNGNSSISSSSYINPTWDHAIDPSLLAREEIGTTSCPPHIRSVYPHQRSSTSELANALTLPPPRQPLQLEQPLTLARQLDQPESCPGFLASQQSTPDVQPPTAQEQFPLVHTTSPDTSETKGPAVPPRFCSVKGCKAVIPGSYEFKMCPPCRTRYRTYGNTKRAKWKYEREAFEREMESLRTLEDEKRKVKGLGPLSDNPEELRTWELSIIDEQVPLPEVANPIALSALAGPMDVDKSSGAHLATPLRFSASIHSPMVVGGAYPASVSSIDSVHSVSPYPHLNRPSLGAAIAPLPARMCTVSHCHKILPGFYRYKRCEQHRLQNRYHSKLKRVREKEIKSAGPEEGEQPSEIPSATSEGGSVEISGDDQSTVIEKSKKDPRFKNPRKERKDKGTKKSKSFKPTEESHPNEQALGAVLIDDTEESEEAIFIPAVKSIESQPKSAKTRGKNERHSKFSCATNNCHNLLTPGIRWRTCEDCRAIERRRKFQARADLKTAENVYWKDVTEKLSVARQTEENVSPMSEGTPVASGSGRGDTHAPTGRFLDGMDDDDDADADPDGEGDTDHEEDEAQGHPADDPAAEASQGQGRPLVWKTTTTDCSGGFSKFRVELPPPPPPLPTAEELMKLDDPLAFRAFKPKTTPSAIGRILARNPQISVDAFSEILEADSSKQIDIPAQESVDCHAESSTSKSIPTPTIPTSEPFVYKAPVKRSIVDEPVATTLTKGKRKATSEDSSALAVSTTAPLPATSAPPVPFAPPYGFPPSYPYYPYYMPPYHMPPYTYPPMGLPSSMAKGPLPIGIPPSGPLPGYFPYPYPPPAYGFSPPSGIPYLPPRYTTPAYGQTSGQQPYPGRPSGSNTAAGYSYYISPSISTASTLLHPTPGIPAPRCAPAKPPLRKDGQFNYYHHDSGHSDLPMNPPNKKKRLKADPHYLQKYDTQSKPIEPILATNQVGCGEVGQGPTTTPSPTASNASLVQESSTAKIQSNPQCERNQSVTTGDMSITTRPCATKACQRTLPVAGHGTICDKCKLRFKKHQVRAKQKFKLEPRKFLLNRHLADQPDQTLDHREHDPISS